MIVRGIMLGIKKDGISWLKDLYTYDGSDAFIENYLGWHDERLTSEVLKTPSGYARDIFLRLSNRRLFKLVYDGKPPDFTPATRRIIFEADKALFAKIEAKIASVYGWDPNLVCARKLTHKSVRTQATTNEGQITVIKPGAKSVFDEESALFKSINDAIREEFVQVYAPVTYKDEKEKKKLQEEYHRDITAMIEQLANPQKPLPLNVAAERPSA